MSVQYFGDHSVTFIKKSGNVITYKRSWVDWHLIPSSRPFVSPAVPNVQILQNGITNRSIDYSEVISGIVTYGRRSGSLEFYIDHDQWSDWSEAYESIMEFINGKEFYCVLEDDHDFAYHGRAVLNEWKNGESYSSIGIGYNFDPDPIHNGFIYFLDKSVTQLKVRQSSNYVSTFDKLNDLNGMLYVTAVFDNGEEYDIDDYSLFGDISTVGNATITLVYGEQMKTFNVIVKDPYDIYEIKAVYPYQKEFFLGNDLNELKGDLKVEGYTSSGNAVEITDGLYTLDGDVSTVGDKTITVNYSGLNAAFNVNVVEPGSINRIEVLYSSGGLIMFSTTDIDALRDRLTVTAYKHDDSFFVTENYTLSGDISIAGTRTVTVSYEGKTTSFTVDIEDSNAVRYISVSAPYNMNVPVGVPIDESVRNRIEVTVHLNDGTSFVTNQYVLDGDTTQVGTINVLVYFYSGDSRKSADFYAKVVEIMDLEIDMVTNTLCIHSEKDIEFSRDYLIVKATLSDESVVEITDYELYARKDSSNPNIESYWVSPLYKDYNPLYRHSVNMLVVPNYIPLFSVKTIGYDKTLPSGGEEKGSGKYDNYKHFDSTVDSISSLYEKWAFGVDIYECDDIDSIRIIDPKRINEYPVSLGFSLYSTFDYRGEPDTMLLPRFKNLSNEDVHIKCQFYLVPR